MSTSRTDSGSATCRYREEHSGLTIGLYGFEELMQDGSLQSRTSEVKYFYGVLHAPGAWSPPTPPARVSGGVRLSSLSQKVGPRFLECGKIRGFRFRTGFVSQ